MIKKSNTSFRAFTIKGAVLLCALAGLVVAFTCASYFSIKNENEYNMEGNVGLRTYFHTSSTYIGYGTEEKPYVITRPIHYYNLTRLQNLGVFTSKTYFKIGYELDPTNNPGTLLVYKSDSSKDSDADPYSTYLDMSDPNYEDNILSIGNESNPFYGVFDGSSIPVDGLVVHSSPEDVGVFGYVASQSIVKNCTFSNLSIYNDGYNTSNLGFLYTADAAANSKLLFNNVEIPSTGSAVYSFSDYSTGTFTASFPTLSSSYDAVVRSSSSLVLPVTNNVVSINTSAFINDNPENKFIRTDNSEINFRISLVASKTIVADSISYSKVLSTFLVKFINNIDTSGNAVVTMLVYRDYVSGTTDSTYTEYAHGNNVGYIVGHTDGTISNCYVYNELNSGGLFLNNGAASSYTRLPVESSIALIGEVGINIENGFSPSEMYGKSGDTGVVNFTEMYNIIRGNGSATKQPSAADSSGSVKNIYSYTPYDNGLFSDFLRQDMNKNNYITTATNTVDFLGQQVIADTDDNNRGLGIFTLTTSNTDNTKDPYATYYLDGFGSYTITKSDTAFTDFYYTTAEYIPLNTTTNKGQVSTNWGNSPYYIGGSGDDTKFYLQDQLDMPTYVDGQTWTPNYEKRSNYYIHANLSSTLSGNYFNTTDSDLLNEYFSYKLIDKHGKKIQPGDPKFGVMVRDVSNSGVETNITSLDSYLTIEAPGNNFATMTSGDNTYATSSVSFKILSESGANVTIMAANFSGCGNYLSIYKKEQTITSPITSSGKRPMYSTYIPSTNSSVDAFSYFEYDPVEETVSTRATVASGSERLFAHTFKLPMGEYLISSPSNSIRIYYIAAQGQSEGNTGDHEVVFTNTDIIEYLDFLLYDPKTNAITESTKSGIYAELYFDASSGSFQIYADSNHILHIQNTDALTKAIILNTKYASLNYCFGDTSVNHTQYYFYPQV